MYCTGSAGVSPASSSSASGFTDVRGWSAGVSPASSSSASESAEPWSAGVSPASFAPSRRVRLSSFSSIPLALACAAALLPIRASAATLTVALDGSGDHTRIDPAMSEAADGDTVLVRPGEYDLDAPLDFRGKAIAVVGEGGSESTVLRLAAPQDADRASVVVFARGESPTARLEGFTLTGGRGVRNCTSCERRGGGVYCVGASPTLRDLVITGNTADFGGGVYLAGDAEPVVSGCSVVGNTGTIGGGICIATGSRAQLRDSTIARNAAAVGGGIHVSNAAPMIDTCTVRDNSAGEDAEGGGVYLGDATRATLRDCTIEGNSAGKGGGISCVRAAATFEGCFVIGNRALGERLDCSAVPGGDDACLQPGGGGVRCLEADPEFIRCRISANSAREGDGGGVQLEFSSSTFLHCVLYGNVARRGGGILASVGEPQLDHCTVAWNSADDAETDGVGGIVSFGAATPIKVTNSIVWRNVGGSLSGFVDVFSSYVEGQTFRDPLFCGWRREEVFVDPAQPVGDGSRERRFHDLVTALASEYSLALRADSPVRGVGAAGTDFGADLGACDSEPIETLTVRLAPGSYSVPSYIPNHIGSGLVLEGAGPEETVLRGTLRLPQAESVLSGLTVTAGDAGGVVMRNRALRIVNCVVRDNRGPGVECLAGARAVLERCTVFGNRPFSGQTVGGVLANSGSATVVSSIVWDNAGSAVSGEADVTFSCIEGGHPGNGNIALDPGFCGWRFGPEIVVSAEPGRVGEFVDPAAFDLSLRADSPCLGSGRNGVDMGADLGVCTVPGTPSLQVRLGPGAYRIDGLGFGRMRSLEGAGAGETLLEGLVTGLRTGSVLSKLTLNGGIVVLGEAPRIENVIIEGSDSAGVLCIDGAAPQLTGCTIRGNGRAPSDGRVGGVHCQDGSHPVLVDCVIRDNTGPGVWCRAGSGATIEHCTIAGNQTRNILGADGAGGGIHVEFQGVVTVTSSIVWNNPAGAIVGDTSRASLDVSFSSIEGGWSGSGNIDRDPRFCAWRDAEVVVDERLGPGVHGRGLYGDLASAIDPSLLSLALAADSPCIGSGKDGTTMGADVGSCDDAPTLTRLVHLAPGRYSLDGRPLAAGVSIRGPANGEAVIAGTVGLSTGSVLEGVTVTSTRPANPRFGSPLIIVEPDQRPVIRRCRLVKGHEGWSGISCSPRSAPRIVGCSLVGGDGVGIRCEELASPIIERCTIVGYTVSCTDSATPTLINTVVAGRSAVAAAAGAHARLIHCTVTGGVDGVAIVGRDSAVVTVKSSIVAGTLSREDGAQILADFSIIELADPDDAIWELEGNINEDPLFVDPGAGDYRLLPNSPAIDAAGLDTGVTDDIDGRPRPCGRWPDIGAYEMGDCEPVLHFLRGDCTADGRVNVTDAVCALEELFGGAAAAHCRAALNTNGDDTIDIADPVSLLNYLFGAGPPPVPPFPECGLGTSAADEELGCASPPECE